MDALDDSSEPWTISSLNIIPLTFHNNLINGPNDKTCKNLRNKVGYSMSEELNTGKSLKKYFYLYDE